ncbi:hypothetical protein KMP11_00430 [Gemella sp. zg-570]|uniref:hypothetical protein n=1 Tax=Gemella sp. zg-570 TaxID=2840371 RepID=UPI001C0AE4FF|nr:hypothetical protein [Gemella sp. zg-570]QWQ38868.1 hypothetical protein KMP11_00430 [Gemella sp. zg-570]
MAKADNPICPAKVENTKIKEFNNYQQLKNFKDIEKYLNLNNMKFLSAYQIVDDEKIVAIINYFSEEDNTYYNLYTDETPEIKFVSTQTEEKNKDKTFKLYSWNGVDFDNSFSISVDNNNKEKNFKLNKRSTGKEVAFSWACLFSSKIACISASVAGGVIGAGITGGWGAAVGPLMGWACSFVFGKLVETYGSKEYGCTLFKNGKLTWDCINNG